MPSGLSNGDFRPHNRQNQTIFLPRKDNSYYAKDTRDARSFGSPRVHGVSVHLGCTELDFDTHSEFLALSASTSKFVGNAKRFKYLRTFFTCWGE